MVERSDEDVLAGVLRIPVGGVEKLVPTLKLRAVRDWQVLVAAQLGSVRPALAPDPTAENIGSVLSLAADGILDLVIAYDKTGALGGREWLEEHADPAQLYAAVIQMGQVTFPFVEGGLGLVQVFPALFVTPPPPVVAPSALTSSTNGHSPTGDSTPEPSKSGSTPTS